jgi:hypothetical protein
MQRQIAAQPKILLGQILYQCQGQVSALSVPNRRIIKQRLKTRGPIFNPAELHKAIKKEWNKITLQEINKAISTMLDRLTAVRGGDGRPIRSRALKVTELR